MKTEDPLTATLLDRGSSPINLEPKEPQDPIDTNFGDRQTYAYIIQDIYIIPGYLIIQGTIK